MRFSKGISLFVLVSLIFGSCTKDAITENFNLVIPQGFPEVTFPEGNPLSASSVKLGRMLFYDYALSVDSSISCAHCHKLELAFTDGLSKSRGVEDRIGTRNSPSLANVAYHPHFLREASLPTLEQQVGVPIQEHAEFDYNIVLLSERLSANPIYVELAMQAYDQGMNPFTITRAIANFERTLLSGNSPYDQFIYQSNTEALSESAKRGMDLFFSERLSCYQCHAGFNFTDYSVRNNGLYEEYEDPGRFRFSGDSTDLAKFKVPSLRNVAITAPYMHNGSVSSLEGVIEHYNSGGKNHVNQDSLIRPLDLSAMEKSDLMEFLKSLSDEHFISNEEDFGPI